MFASPFARSRFGAGVRARERARLRGQATDEMSAATQILLQTPPPRNRARAVKTVLVIDDNPHQRAILSRYLQFVGAKVIEASDGEEGVRLAREHRPTLVLLDLRMPVLDGWGAIRRLRADPATAHLPVVALTATPSDWARLKMAGFTSYLPKPIAPYTVLQEVERCAGRLS